MMCSAIQPKRCWPTPFINIRTCAEGLIGRKVARLLLYGIYGVFGYHAPKRACHSPGTHCLFATISAAVCHGLDVRSPICLCGTNSQLGPAGEHLDPRECGRKRRCSYL